MATKDIPDKAVLLAYQEYRKLNTWPEKLLMQMTGQPYKVCLKAMERASKRGLIDHGVSIQSGWLTEEGKKVLGEGGGGFLTMHI
jgi:hypothetical protein